MEKNKVETEKKKYWYYITIYRCVLCGKEEVYKYRRYDEKPEAWEKRHEYIEFACGGHFL